MRAGRHTHNETGPEPKNLIGPICDYPHTKGLSVTGGYMYRGRAIPGLVGKYGFTFPRFNGKTATNLDAPARAITFFGLTKFANP